VRGHRWGAVLGSVWLCAGCAEPAARLPELDAATIAAELRRQQIAQIRDYYARVARVDRIAYRIRVANRTACKERVAPSIGLTVATVRSLPRKYRSYSVEALNVSWTRPTVIAVAADSPAAAAGIKTGDQILTLDNAPVPPNRPMGWISDRLRRNGTRTLTVVLRRDGIDRTTVLLPVIGCAIPIHFVIDPKPGASTDDERIVVQSGILRVARSDADLATIIGHELAHVNMSHYSKKFQNALLGQLGGAVIDGGFMLGGIYTGGVFSKQLGRAGARAFSVEFEREADYVGAYYAARAGYDISGTENVWRALALENPAAIRLTRTHPAAPARFVQMQKVIAEIADKKRRDVPLEPELKPRRRPVTVGADVSY